MIRLMSKTNRFRLPLVMCDLKTYEEEERVRLRRDSSQFYSKHRDVKDLTRRKVAGKRRHRTFGLPERLESAPGKRQGKTLSIIESGTEQAPRGAVQGAPPAFSERLCRSGATVHSNVVQSANPAFFGAVGRASVVK